MKKFWSSLWEIVEVVLIAVVTVFVIRTFVAQPFLVSGASMEPNFTHGNYLLIDEITYRFREPERGEVIVFRSPTNRSIFFIKRIIGLPGERVVVADGKVRIFSSQGDEVPIREDYLVTTQTGGKTDIQLSVEEYAVFGDNRNNSFDSRNWGLLPAENIIGIVRVRLFPFNKIQVFAAPAY